MVSTWTGMMIRKKNLFREISPLERVYNVGQTTLFCFGGIVGVHLYSRVPDATLYFGPLATSWYIIGGMIALSLARCYGELISQAPCSGAAYEYCYHTVCELVAFFVGWLMILSLSTRYVLSIRSLTKFIDQSFFDSKIKKTIDSYVVIFPFSKTSIFEKSPDLSGILISLIVGGLHATFSKESAFTNCIFAVINSVVIVITFTLFIFFVDLDEMRFETNFNKTTDFFAHGLSVAQHSYSGLELAAYLGEEAVDPGNTLPRSITLATILAILCYTVISFLCSLVPRSLTSANKGSILEVIKDLQMGREVAWLVGLGGVCGMSASSYAILFALTRLVYSMANDGLLFTFLSNIKQKTKTPLASTYMFAISLGTLAVFIKLEYIHELATFYMSLDYFTISICLLITRYRCEQRPRPQDPGGRWFLLNIPKKVDQTPTKVTERLSFILIVNASLSMYTASVLINLAMKDERSIYTDIYKACAILCFFLFIVFGILLGRQPQNGRKHLPYSIRRYGGIPFIPLFLLAYSILLLEPFASSSWLVSFSWLALGLVFYLTYSCNHSTAAGRLHPDRSQEFWEIMLRNDPMPRNSPSSESDVAASESSMSIQKPE